MNIILFVGSTANWKGIAGITCVVVVCSVSPALASRTNNVDSTRAYLRLSNAYARSLYPQVGAMVHAIEARASEIAKRCPLSLAYAPRDYAFEELGEETSRSLLYAGAVPARSMMLRFAGAIDRLTWSDRKLTRLVRAQAATEREVAGLGLPNICAQIEAWRASAYATIPPEADDYLKSMGVIESESTVEPSEESREVVIRSLLRRYEDPSERRLAERVKKLEERTETRLDTMAIAVRSRLAAALGVTEL